MPRPNESHGPAQGTGVTMAQRMARAAALGAAVFALGAAVNEREASACGACFVSASESTIVSDHRMALAVSTRQTVLWDQIRYQGNPSEFAYVIPARVGTRIEVSHDGWFAALDASTRPIVMSPQTYGGGGGGGGGYYPGSGRGGGYYGTPTSSSGGSGCCNGFDSFAASAEPGSFDGYADASYSAGGNSAAPGERQADPVQIVDQQVIGPYETVTLRSEDPEALQKWLTANGFAIPAAAQPILADYVAQKLDFIAMRLRPSQGVRAMEPIRIITPGADATLPLRMMKIGAGARLGITLFVIGEGRYHPKNFPDALIDPSKLVWDTSKRLSNYQQLSIAEMTKGDGRAWLTEYAKQPDLDPRAPLPSSGTIGNPGLAAGYTEACPPYLPYETPDASVSFGSDSGSGGAADASDDAAPEDASIADAGVSDASDDAEPPRPPRTKRCDDLDVALTGLHRSDVWVTRMRAFLPSDALDEALVLEPTPIQGEYENIHVAPSTGTVSAGISIPRAGERGTYAMILAACAIVWRMLRRRRRA